MQTLAFGSLTLHLGDDERTTLAALSDRYKSVTEFGKGKLKGVDQFIVEKQNDDIVGVVTFVNGTLSKAYCDWTPNETSAYEVVRAKDIEITAISSSQLAGKTTVSVYEWLDGGRSGTLWLPRKSASPTWLPTVKSNPHVAYAIRLRSARNSSPLRK